MGNILSGKEIYGDLEVKALVHVSVNEGFILSFFVNGKIDKMSVENLYNCTKTRFWIKLL